MSGDQSVAVQQILTILPLFLRRYGKKYSKQYSFYKENTRLIPLKKLSAVVVLRTLRKLRRVKYYFVLLFAYIHNKRSDEVKR